MSDSDKRLPSSALTDPKAIRQQGRTRVHSLDRLRPSEAYWLIESVVGEVRQMVEQAWELHTAVTTPSLRREC